MPISFIIRTLLCLSAFLLITAILAIFAELILSLRTTCIINPLIWDVAALVKVDNMT
jgi:hypothetical protein